MNATAEAVTHLDLAFWQPINLPLPKVARTYCTRPEWSTPGESAWMLLSKFSWCNRLLFSQLMQVVAPASDDPPIYGVDLRRADRLDSTALLKGLALPALFGHSMFCGDGPHWLIEFAETDLRYCPECLRMGFHSALYQWRFLSVCPLHRTPLSMGCPRCGEAIAYRLEPALCDSPLRCGHCRAFWVPSLARAAGRSAPLSANQIERIARWRHYLLHALSPVADAASTAAMDETTGRFSSAAARSRRNQLAGRVEYIAVLNRLYSMPPPFGVARLKRESAAPYANALRSPPPVPWPERRWPHFGDRFRALESTLECNAVARRLRITCGASRVSRYFDSQGTAPAAAFSAGEMATLGWCMSWYGFHQPASIFMERQWPAFGLSAWLARCRDRPPFTLQREWLALLTYSLQLDLDASWRVWHDITCFMKRRGTYYLHPSLARPSDFAQAHRSTCAHL